MPPSELQTNFSVLQIDTENSATGLMGGKNTFCTVAVKVCCPVCCAMIKYGLRETKSENKKKERKKRKERE